MFGPGGDVLLRAAATARNHSRNSRRCRAARSGAIRQNGSFDIAPLGNKEVVATNQVVPGNEGQVRVFFVWKLVPNEIGKEIDLLDQIFIDENEAMATLIRDGTSWSVLKITSV